MCTLRSSCVKTTVLHHCWLCPHGEGFTMGEAPLAGAPSVLGWSQGGAFLYWVLVGKPSSSRVCDPSQQRRCTHWCVNEQRAICPLPPPAVSEEPCLVSPLLAAWPAWLTSGASQAGGGTQWTKFGEKKLLLLRVESSHVGVQVLWWGEVAVNWEGLWQCTYLPHNQKCFLIT